MVESHTMKLETAFIMAVRLDETEKTERPQSSDLIRASATG
jgi:hypothetical protein